MFIFGLIYLRWWILFWGYSLGGIRGGTLEPMRFMNTKKIQIIWHALDGYMNMRVDDIQAWRWWIHWIQGELIGRSNAGSSTNHSFLTNFLERSWIHWFEHETNVGDPLLLRFRALFWQDGADMDVAEDADFWYLGSTVHRIMAIQGWWRVSYYGGLSHWSKFTFW